mmetsp:Transcript_95485/g.169546  ORF Transcript_95485/g.169546 Transcript_95485/m.169546 type:complete len:92 (+) Transcript_95485:55-330(+)
MGASSCCLTSDAIRDEAAWDVADHPAVKQGMTQPAVKEALVEEGSMGDGTKHVKFAGEEPAPSPAKRLTERKGTGFVNTAMLKDLQDEEED